MADAPGERGFTLIEVLICVALLAAACVAALGVLPALARASQRTLLRDAATAAGRTAIDRVRAATAYYPASGYRPDHGYALNAVATYATVAHVHRALCAANAVTTDVPLAVALAYDAASDRVDVTVDYPRSACDPSVTESVRLSAQLAPSALVPGTPVAQPIDDPARQ